VNARARALVASLRGILGMYPGATAIVEIHMVTEEDALLLGAARLTSMLTRGEAMRTPSTPRRPKLAVRVRVTWSS
jgi:hypothetical protein